MNIFLVHARNPSPYTGAGNNTYLIDGREPALIDAGTGEPGHLEDLRRALAGRALARVLVTHGHVDHASGAEAIAAAWPSALFLKMPWPDRDDRYHVEWRPIADGDLIPAGDGTLRAIHTPGHAPDHLCFFDAEGGALFAGDLIVSSGTVVIPASHGGSLVQYLASLKRVLALGPARLLPAHGGAVDEPGLLIRRYVEHRRERERQIVSALAEGDRAVDAIVSRIYTDLAPELRDAAGESVLAHLVKLESEGRVERSGEEWVLLDL